jgi:hypothetical protein
MFGEELERPPEIDTFRRDRGPGIFHGHRERIHQVVDRFFLLLARALFAVWSHRSAAGSILATSDLAS